MTVLWYRADAGPAQRVCRLSPASPLKELCFAGFPATAGTVLVWLKVPATADTGGTVLAYRPPAGSDAPSLTVTNPHNLQVAIAPGASAAVPTGVSVADDVWRQLAVSYERVLPATWIVTVYLDSLPLWRSQALRSTRALEPGGDLYLGWNGDSGGDLAGLASELQVWARPLDERAVATGLLRRSPETATDLALRWPLDAPPPGNPDAEIVPSMLRFRTGTTILSWTAISDATGYEIEAGATDGRWNAVETVAPTTSWTLPDPPLTRLGARLRATFATGPGPWIPVTEIIAFELVQTAVMLSWDSAAATLTASWPDVPRRDSFTLELYRTGDPEPVVTTGYTQLSYSLTGMLDDSAGARLDVRGSAAGSLGPPQPALPLAAPTLTDVRYELVGRVLRLRWEAVTGAEFLRLRVTPESGPQQAYTAMLDGDALTAVLTDAQYPLQPGVAYTVALRALGGGTLTSWADATVRVRDVPAPVLSWVLAPAPDLLDATWNAVGTNASYDLALYRADDPEPVDRRTGLTTRSYPLATHLDEDGGHTVRVAAIDAGIKGPANVPAPVGALDPRWWYLVESETLSAAWSTDQPDAYLRVERDSGSRPDPVIGTGGEATFPAPVADYPEGTTLTLNCRALAPGTLGTVETAALTVHRLAIPVPTLRYQRPQASASGSGGSLILAWPAIDPPLAVTYQERTTADGTPGPARDVAGTQLDVTPLLETAGVLSTAVRGTAEGSIGPWSAAPAPAAPSWESLSYDVVTTRITGTWTPGTGRGAVDASLLRDGAATAEQRQWLPGTATSAEFAVPSGSVGQRVALRLRAVAGTAMSDFARREVTLLQVPGPLLHPLTDTIGPDSVTASWSFDVPTGTTGLGYLAELRTGDTLLATKSVTDPATTSTTFTESDGIRFQGGTLYTVTVRARVRPAPGQVILGAWSGSVSINFGADVDLTLAELSANSDAAGNITLGWRLRDTVPDATFEVRVDGVDVTRTGLTGTSAELRQADTHVSVGTTYTVRMRAVLAAISGPWRETTVTAGHPPDPGPGPDRGDPVLIRTGALAQTGVDLLVPAVVPLAFTVTYRSDSPLPTDDPPLPASPLGARWNHVYNARIVRVPDGRTVALIGGDLSVVAYQVPSSITGGYPQLGVPNGSILVVGADLTYTLTRADGSVAGFDADGALRWMTDPAGNRTQLSYGGARLSRVTDVGSGRWLDFSYDGDGRITAVTASTGASIGYGYDATGNQTSATDPLGGVRTFGYDAASRMTGATDQLRRPSLRNVYDARGRITLQQDARALADGAEYGTHFAYHSGGGVDSVVVTDREGRLTTYDFDPAARVLLAETAQLASGTVRRVRYTRDGNGNALTVSVFEGPADSTEPGQTWRYTYDAIGNVTSVTDPLGGRVTTSYDGAYHPVSVTDRLGNTTRFQWQGNLLARVTDPLGGTTLRTYTSGPVHGLLATETDPYGATASYSYDPAGRLTRLVDATGAVTLPAWSPLGWPAGYTRQSADGATALVQETDTNAMGWPVVQRERYAGQPAESPFATVWHYAPTGTPTSTTDPLGAVTTFEYGPDLMLTQVGYPASTPPGDRTIYRYDRENELAGIDYGADVREEFASDQLGRPVSYTDPRGGVWRIGYAMSGPNLVQTLTLPAEDPVTGAPLTRSVATDPLGRPVAFTDTAGGVTRVDYATVPIAGTQTFGLRVTTTLPPADGSAALTRGRTYDAAGRLVASTAEDGTVTVYSYEPASSVPQPPAGATVAVTLTRPSGLVERYLLDGAGRLIQTRRGNGTDQRYADRGYDPLGRVVTAAHRGGALEVTAACDYTWQAGEVIATISVDGTAGAVRRYDPLGRLLSVRDQAGGRVSYGYTPAGLLTNFTNARGQRVGYGHDAAARLVRITPPDGADPIEQVLDGSGNRTATLVGGEPTITRTFDPLNRLISRTAGGATVGFRYDALGGLAGLSYPAPAGETPPEVGYRRDAAGRLTTVTDWAGRVTRYGHRPTGELSWQESPNGVRTEAGYDVDGRLTTLTTTARELVVARASYGYDAFDAPVAVSELLPAAAVPAVGARILHYDGDRLTEVEGPDGGPLGYDADGNVLTAPGLAGPLGYDVFGELTGAGPVTVTRDADGLLTGIAAGGRMTTLVHDPGGYANPWREQADPLRATRAGDWQPLPTGGLALTPVLLAAFAPAGVGVPDGGQPPGRPGAVLDPPSELAATGPAWSGPLAALDRRLTETAGGQTVRYVHGVGLIGAERADGSFASYVFDANGNTLALALPDGTLTGRQVHDAFGAVLGGDPVAQPFGLAGRLGVASDIPGLALMRTRAYAPGLLRFTSQDYLLGELTDPQSLNRYGYLHGAPLLRVDPLGMDGFPLWGAILVGVAAGVVVIGGAVVGGLYAAGVLGGAGAGAAATGTATGVATGVGADVATVVRPGGGYGWRQVFGQLMRRRPPRGFQRVPSQESFELESVGHEKWD